MCFNDSRYLRMPLNTLRVLLPTENVPAGNSILPAPHAAALERHTSFSIRPEVYDSVRGE